jgi:uncharacterized repeat protein (TIGR04076 family)
MADTYDVKVKVISQKGTCGAGHRVGDEWTIGDKTPAGICMYAFNSLLADWKLLKFGGTIPWETNPDTTRVACIDAANPVVFELKRLR